MANRIGSILWQAKLPIAMACVVIVLIVVTLRANEQRQCREVCLKNGFAGSTWAKPLVGEGQCDCITREGRQVPAPQGGR
jgi:hypothetical protein